MSKKTLLKNLQKKQKLLKKTKTKVFKYFFYKNIVKLKIEEAFSNMDKYETTLNDIDQKLWDVVKFPLENVIKECK